MKISRKDLNLIIENFLKEDTDLTGMKRLIRELRVYNNRVEIYVNIENKNDNVVVGTLNDIGNVKVDDTQTPNITDGVEARYEFQMLAVPSTADNPNVSKPTEIINARLISPMTAPGTKGRNILNTGLSTVTPGWAQPDSSGNIILNSFDFEPLSGRSSISRFTAGGTTWKWETESLHSSNEDDRGFASFKTAKKLAPGTVDYMGYDGWDEIIQYKNGSAIISSQKLKEDFDEAYDAKGFDISDNAIEYRKIIKELGLPDSLAIKIFPDSLITDTRTGAMSYPDEFFIQIKDQGTSPRGMESANDRSESDHPLIKLKYDDLLAELSKAHESPKMPPKIGSFEFQLANTMAEDDYLKLTLLPSNRSYAIEMDIDPSISAAQTGRNTDTVKETIFTIYSAHTLSVNKKVAGPFRLKDGSIAKQITINIDVAEKWKPDDGLADN